MCLLLLCIAKLPGMNHLVWCSYARAYETHRVLNTDVVYGRIHQQAHEFQCFSRLPPTPWSAKPDSTRYSQVRAGWVSNHQVPAIVEYVPHVSTVMVARVGLAAQQITRHSKMPSLSEGISYPTTKLTRYQHSHQGAHTLV